MKNEGLIASLEDKTMSSIIEGLIDDYIHNFQLRNKKAAELNTVMKVSEPSFEEWDNDEDNIYDRL